MAHGTAKSRRLWGGREGALEWGRAGWRGRRPKPGATPSPVVRPWAGVTIAVKIYRAVLGAGTVYALSDPGLGGSGDSEGGKLAPGDSCGRDRARFGHQHDPPPEPLLSAPGLYGSLVAWSTPQLPHLSSGEKGSHLEHCYDSHQVSGL